MKQGLSIRAFAQLSGFSHTAVSNAVRDGHLIAFPDGSLDPALANTAWNRTKRRAGAPPVPKLRSRTAVTAATVTLPMPLSGVHPLACSEAANAETAAVYAAELLLPLLPEAAVREVAEALGAKLRAGAVDWLENDGIAPPAGVASWAAWEGFSGPAVNDPDWADLLAGVPQP